MSYLIVPKGTKISGYWTVIDYDGLDASPSKGLVVHQEDAVDTGLTDKDGNHIFRGIDPVGFMRY